MINIININTQEDIVLDVLEKLREAARREAELLFREHRNHPATPLPAISERISNAINSVTDAVLKILDDAPSAVRFARSCVNGVITRSAGLEATM